MEISQEERFKEVFPKWDRTFKHLVVQVRAEYKDTVDSMKKELERFHSINSKALDSVKEGNYISIILPETPYNTVKSVQQSLKDFVGLAYAPENVTEKDVQAKTLTTASIKSIREQFHQSADNSSTLKNN